MAPLTADYVLDIAKQCIQTTEYCFLMTFNDQAGRIDTRLMQPFPPTDDLTIWFGASPRSRKVAQIRQHNQVTLGYQARAEPAYVMLAGTAQIEEDLALRRHYWRDDWLPFFPAGPEGDDYVLINVIPTRIEMMHFVYELAPDPYGLKPVVLVRVGAGWSLEA